MKLFNQRIKNHYLIILTSILFIDFSTGCNTSSSKKIDDTTVKKNVVKLYVNKGVSLISLIANPEKYYGKIIRVKGFLSIAFEGNAIYVHKEDYDLGLDKNSVWLAISKEEMISSRFKNCNKKYVLLEGTFSKNKTGNFGDFNGEITQITRLEILK